MKKSVLIFFLMVFFASAVFGASSRDNRGDSIIFIGYTPLGIHPTTFIAPPLSLGIILGESVELGVEFSSWEDTDSDDGVTYKGEFSNSGVFLKWFPGNSFYFSLSGHKREFTISANGTLSDGVTQYGATLNTDATVIGVGVGNQWMFDFGLYIGVDWLMLSGAASSSKSYTIVNESLYGASELAEIQQELDDLGDTLNKWSASSGLVILTVGFAF